MLRVWRPFGLSLAVVHFWRSISRFHQVVSPASSDLGSFGREQSMRGKP